MKEDGEISTGNCGKTKGTYRKPKKNLCQMKEVDELKSVRISGKSSILPKMRVSRTGMNKKAEHFKDNGKLRKKHVKQEKEENERHHKAKNNQHIPDPGLAVDLRRMPSTCPCRASVQGYRGSSHY